VPPERLGKYDVLRKIASGGMSEVWLCRLSGEEGFEKKVAVKVIHPRFSDDPRFRELFAREARIAASLSHQNLVQVFDFGRHGTSCYLAMEFVPGWNLAQATAQSRLRAVPVPLSVWRHWLEGILAGIGYLHSRGIVHRDVSPSNILLSRGGAVKIADLGIARGARHGTGGGEGREGKFAYMSPEQARGEDATFSSDLFAAAVVAAELFLPGRLFEGASPHEIMDRLRGFDPARLSENTFPIAVDGLLRKALSGGREGRYPNADEFADALRAAVPLSVGHGQLSSYWDMLFAASETGEDATVVVEGPPAAKPGVIRESPGEYRSLRSRRVLFGAAGALAAFSIGAVLVWNGTRSGDREGAPGTRGAASPASPWASRAGDGKDGEARAKDSGRFPEARPDAPEPKAFEVRAGKSGGAPSVKPRGISLETDPPDVAVSVDEEIPLGKTPLRIDISHWKGRTITFQKEGYVGRAIRVESLTELPNFRMEMERQTGTVETVQAIPWARVYDGDRYLGDTPFGPLTLTTGEHRLRFVNEPLGIEKEEKVLIRPGGNPKIIVYLVRE